MRDGGGNMWVWHAESRVLRAPTPFIEESTGSRRRVYWEHNGDLRYVAMNEYTLDVTRTLY